MRTWLNGRRRAPAWFVAILDGELARQIEHRQAIRAELANIKTGDRRRSPEARTRGRLAMMRRYGRLEAEKSMGEAAVDGEAAKNEPHKSP